MFATKIGTVLCTVFAIVSAIFANQIMWWFCEDAEVARIGIETIYISSIAMPVLAFSTYVNQLYQGLGFKAQATFLASCRQGIFFVPTILLLPLVCGCIGVQATQPVADVLTFFAAFPFIVYFYCRYIKDYIKPKE